MTCMFCYVLTLETLLDLVSSTFAPTLTPTTTEAPTLPSTTTTLPGIVERLNICIYLYIPVYDEWGLIDKTIMFQLTVHYLYGVVGILVRRRAEQEQQ